MGDLEVDGGGSGGDGVGGEDGKGGLDGSNEDGMSTGDLIWVERLLLLLLS